jgi:phosphate transport system permease protein
MNRKIETESDVVIFPKKTMDIVKRGLARRYRSERRFKFLGLSAIIASLLFLTLLFASIIGNGYTAFGQTFIRLDIYFDPHIITEDNLSRANYPGLVKSSLHSLFPDVSGRQNRRALEGLVSKGCCI